MATKAILVTNANQSELTAKYHAEDGSGVPIAVGYYLVSDFGDHFGYDIMSSAKFFQKFEQGPDIRNGFFEALKRWQHG